MSEQSLRFNCPCCGIQLEVPVQLAGVVGPCPSCQARITAPLAPPPAAQQHQRPSAPAPAPVPISQHQPQPATSPLPDYSSSPTAYRAPAPSPEPSPSQPAVAPYLPPQHYAPPAQPAAPSTLAGQPVFPPHPAQIPVQSQVQAPAQAIPVSPPARSARNISEAPGAEAHNITHAPPARSTRRKASRLPSFLFLFTMLALLGAAVLGILVLTDVVGINQFPFLRNIIKPAAPTTQPHLHPNTPPTESPSAVIVPDEVPQTDILDDPIELGPIELGDEMEEGQDDVETLPEAEEDETPLPPVIEEITSKEQVRARLERFIHAKTFAERSDLLVLGSVDQKKHKNSLLAGPIPPPAAIAYYAQEVHTDDNRRDFFYVVAWSGVKNSPKLPITVLLSQWGRDSSRVHGAAFEQAYKGQVQLFADIPSEELATFHVLSRCLTQCFENIPDSVNLATLRIFSHPNDKQGIMAYFKKKSTLFDELKAYRRGLAFEQIVPLTVTLKWNQDENFKFVELVSINSFDWYP